MANKRPEQRYEIGMVGLGVMGRNLLLNMADHGHSVAGYDKDATKVAALRQHFPDLKIRVVNVVDLMTLQTQTEHPHGLSDRDFDALFTTDKPIIFAYHGYPWLIHRLAYRRNNHHNLHVRGYKEEGTTGKR